MNVAEAECILNRAKSLRHMIGLIHLLQTSSKPLLIGVVEREFDGHATRDARCFMEVERSELRSFLEAKMAVYRAELAVLEDE